MDDGPIRSTDAGVTLDIWVVPGAARSEITGLYDQKLRVRIAAPAEKGRANKEAIRYLTEILGSKVVLVGGMSSRHKVFQVSGMETDSVERKLRMYL
ncbi:MAG: DUF167 domain-containing protein [Acidimicrobiia bacterium]